MRLKSLKVENLRSLGSVDIEFGDGWSTFLGNNGTGKSTLLRALGLVTAGSDALAELVGDPNGWVREGADSARIFAELITVRGEPRSVELTINADDNMRTLLHRNRESLEPVDGALAHANRSYFVVGYGATRVLGAANLTRENGRYGPRARRLATLFDRSATLSPLESWAVNLDYERGEKGLSVVANTLGKLLEEVRFVGIDKKSRRMMFETPDGTVPLDRLSDGLQNMVGWLGDLLYSVTEGFGDYDQPLDAHGILLIDEIGLHLHPTWQRRMLTFVREQLKNFQVIATTHSPLVVSSMHEGEVFVLHRHAHGIDVRRPEESLHGQTPDQILRSEVFGLDDARDPEFAERLDAVRVKASLGDEEAAEQLQRMLVHGVGGERDPN